MFLDKSECMIDCAVTLTSYLQQWTNEKAVSIYASGISHQGEDETELKLFLFVSNAFEKEIDVGS